ncbi:family 78 glycoside hydrolase catalytic domain [Luteolibacter flavescens]|uniref:alpha-L-rhamnosidase n=1 Tax=Luteolibacter flavescens TaxID=1859460 RepID=A0ABT3FSE6_9BACT|nr:family 78 glycoside hydrolase catalytic domain [Luteolibacter flavescens]MCW1886509.1 family 78 glycoside hydrolase catalytic domain [Luteolibacter flavescens]
MLRPLAIVLTISCTCLTAQERSPVVATRDEPVKAEKQADGRWFIDFGKATFGTVEITSPDARAGTKISVHMGEALAGPSTLNRKPSGTVRYQGGDVVLKARTAVQPELSWKPPGWMKEGWLSLPKGAPEMMPFRYVEIEGAPPSFSADQIKRVSWAVPFDEKASAFQSSSPQLDAVWDLCKHSIKATTFMGLYVDGDRERKPYEADVLINQLGHYCLDARYDTARLTHEYLLEKPTWPTEWRLQSVILAWHDFLWSGDDRSLRKHYETLKGRAMIERRTADGLFEGWNQGEITDIVDWPAGERDGYDMSPTVKIVVTAFHYRSLVLLEKIATHLGKDADAREFAAMAKATHLAVNEKLWDEGQGCYIDGLDPKSGNRSSHASAHANFFPLALGLVPEDRVASVAAFLKLKGMTCSVYGAQFLLEGLYEAGEGDFALALLTSSDMRSWRNMSEKVGSTMTLEAWDPSLKPNLDWNHAWGAAPSNLIPRGLMGIEPLEPGFKRFRVRPQTGGLEEAKLKLPTPKGPVILELKGKDASAWSAKLVVPAGTAAEFHLPHPGEAALTSAGKTAPTRVLRKERGRTVLGIGPGSWEISLKK